MSGCTTSTGSEVELSQTARVSAHLDLPVSPGRAATTSRAIGTMLATWGLPLLRSQRWLAAAQPLLDGPLPLELFLQLDRVSSIITVELWHDGARVFGIDDWVGF